MLGTHCSYLQQHHKQSSGHSPCLQVPCMRTCMYTGQLLCVRQVWQLSKLTSSSLLSCFNLYFCLFTSATLLYSLSYLSLHRLLVGCVVSTYDICSLKSGSSCTLHSERRHVSYHNHNISTCCTSIRAAGRSWKVHIAGLLHQACSVLQPDPCKCLAGDAPAPLLAWGRSMFLQTHTGWVCSFVLWEQLPTNPFPHAHMSGF